MAVVCLQELSGHLAAEITRLCSQAKRDELPLSQGMDAYEMEVSVVFSVEAEEQEGGGGALQRDQFSHRVRLTAVSSTWLCCHQVAKHVTHIFHCVLLLHTEPPPPPPPDINLKIRFLM